MRLSATALRSAVSARSRGSLSRTRSTMLQPTVTSRMSNDAYVTMVTVNGPGLWVGSASHPDAPCGRCPSDCITIAICGPLTKLSGMGVTSPRAGGRGVSYRKGVELKPECAAQRRATVAGPFAPAFQTSKPIEQNAVRYCVQTVGAPFHHATACDNV